MQIMLDIIKSGAGVNSSMVAAGATAVGGCAMFSDVTEAVTTVGMELMAESL